MRDPVRLRDVTLRDGLQDAPPIPTERKLAIFEALLAAGVRELELTSFVRPDRVPSMADAETLCAATADHNVVRWGLVLNERGAMRAVGAGLTHLQFVVSVSDTHSHENAGRSTAAAIDALAGVCDLAGTTTDVEVTLATAFGCPFEHRVDPDRVTHARPHPPPRARRRRLRATGPPDRRRRPRVPPGSTPVGRPARSLHRR